MTRTNDAFAELAARAAVAREVTERHRSLVREVARRTETGWLRYEACQLVIETGRRRRAIESGRMFPLLAGCVSGDERRVGSAPR